MKMSSRSFVDSLLSSLLFERPPISGLGGSTSVNVDGKSFNNERDAFDSVDDTPDNKNDGNKSDKESNKESKRTRGQENAEDTEETDTEDSEEEDGTDEVDEEDDEEGGEDTEEEDEVDEDEEETDEEEEEDNTELANDSIHQSLKKLDKDIYKKIPGLKEVIFREQAYTQVFPTVDSAKRAAEAAKVLNAVQADLLSGNVDPILTFLNKAGKRETENFLANFLPSIRKQSKELYFDTIAPVLKEAFRIAASDPDQRISVAAKNMHYFIFGDTDFDKAVGLRAAPEDEREKELKKREQQIIERQYQSFQSDVASVVESRGKREIEAGFKDSGLSKWQLTKLVDDIFHRVGQSLNKDPRHMGNMKRLWEEAASNGFTSQEKNSIVSAYLSRFKALIPKHRQEVLAESKLQVQKAAGGGKKKKATRVTSSSTGSRTGKNTGHIDIKKVDLTKTSERDLFDPDAQIHYKGQ